MYGIQVVRQGYSVRKMNSISDMTTDSCQPTLSKSELTLLVRVLRNELCARQHWLDICSDVQSRDYRPALPSLTTQQEEYRNLARIYRQLRTLEKQIAGTEQN